MKELDWQYPLQWYDVLEIKVIKEWLATNEDEFDLHIDETSCRKWDKWRKDEDIILFPCACFERDKYCIFIEIYYELLVIEKLYDKENVFKYLVLEYKEIENDVTAVLSWYNKYKEVAKKTNFKPEIKIMLQLEPYERATLKLVEAEFKNVMEFQRIIHKIYLELDDED